MNKKIVWKNSDEDLSKFNKLRHQNLVASKYAKIQGEKNVESGHLQKISSKGGISTGNNNIKTGHMERLNKSLTSEIRSKNRKKKISKEQILELQSKNYSKTEISKILNISLTTYRTKCKEYNIYEKPKKQKIKCKYCDKIIDKQNHAKYHGDKCKQNPKNNLDN